MILRNGLSKHECACRKWQISGIPCAHAIVGIMSMKLDMPQYVDVDGCFKKKLT